MATDDLETKNQKQDKERFYKSGNCARLVFAMITSTEISFCGFLIRVDNPSEQQPSRDLLPLWPRPTSLHLSNCPLTISKGKVDIVLYNSLYRQKAIDLNASRDKINSGFKGVCSYAYTLYSC